MPSKRYSSDATIFALADAGDGMDDANFVTEIANSAVMKLTKAISWMEEVTAAESKLRAGPPTTFADRVFANEMNIAIKEAEKNYNAFMFKDALKFGFCVLQLTRDEYRLSCGAAGMNRDLLWRFMDVQTRLITPICPHYAEHMWQKIMKKEGIVIKAGWPDADTPDPTLRIANKYLQDSIVLMRKLLQEQESGSKKPKKGATPAPPSKEKKMSIGLIYVNEHYCGWEEQCLRVLQSKFDSQSRSFAPDQEIAEALKGCTVGQEMNLKQVQQLCMPFIKKKKDEAREVGPQALDLKLPFSEMDVLRENLEPIKRQLGLEQVEVLPASDEAARAKAGEHASLLEKKTPSPGKPIAIFLSKQS
jgi:leucyl-tRNA synthetase